MPFNFYLMSMGILLTCIAVNHLYIFDEYGVCWSQKRGSDPMELDFIDDLSDHVGTRNQT